MPSLTDEQAARGRYDHKTLAKCELFWLAVSSSISVRDDRAHDTLDRGLRLGGRRSGVAVASLIRAHPPAASRRRGAWALIREGRSVSGDTSRARGPSVLQRGTANPPNRPVSPRAGRDQRGPRG